MTAPPVPAATLVLFREAEGITEHLFVERAGTMSFAAGAIVFPGGRVDGGDRHVALSFPGTDPDDAAARVAAIRETIEEAGVAVGLTPPPGAATVADIRAGLADGQVFSDLLAAAGLALDISGLVPFARWCPNFREARSYDTRFYLARLPQDAHLATVDETENVRLFWASAQSVLDKAHAGEVHIIFPTRRNLERLASFAGFAEAEADAARFPPEIVTPWMEDRDGIQHLCIPENLGYPICSQPLSEIRRG